MEASCENVPQDNQVAAEDFMADDEDVEVFPAPSALHILDLPDSVIFQIFVYLPFSSIGAISQVCKRFGRISSDELLWRHVFLQHYKLSANTVMPAKAQSWRQEFKRLYYHTPAVLSEERKEHKDEVLHVSLSHDGTMFATCSKDGFFKIWECTHPVRLLFKMDMKSTFSWKFTQFSQFNETDTCLLVSGVYFGRLSTSGEIAVFNLQDDFRMQCRVTNKPYDVFGAWYDNDHLLSGTLYWTGDFNSVSAVWLSKASQEVESEVESVSMVLYRFENVNSSSIRLLHVAEVDKDADTSESIIDKEELEVSESSQTSPYSSSLALGEDGKSSMDVDSSISRSEVQDKCQGQENMPGEESCLLDLLLQRYTTDDEFQLDDKTDNDGEGDDFHVEPRGSIENGQMDYSCGSEMPSEAERVSDLAKTSSNLSEVTLDLHGASDIEHIDVGDREVDRANQHLTPSLMMTQEQTGDGSAGCLEGAGYREAFPSNRQIDPDIIMESDLAQAPAADAPLRDTNSQSTIICECSSGLITPEKQCNTSLTSAKTNEFTVPQYSVVSGTRTSRRILSDLSFASNNISTGAECVDCLTLPSSTYPLGSSLVQTSNTTDNYCTESPSQEFESVISSSDSLLLPSMFDISTYGADIRNRNASASGNLDEGGTRCSDVSNISSSMDVACMPEDAMEVLEYREPGGNHLEDSSTNGFVVADVGVSAVGKTSAGVNEGASCIVGISESSDRDQKNLITTDKFGLDFEGASDSSNTASGGVVSVSENKPGARDVSQQFGNGLGSQDTSVLNVPSMFDNNLVMLIPGASHVYGSRNFSSAAQNTNGNSASNHNSNNIDSISSCQSDVQNVDMSAREAGTSHKNSIATQTEIASSRASSFHSLSHISQSSSISRDFRCSPPREKLLIYTWGSETYIPHKVGIKRMKWTDFTKVAATGEVTARRSSMLLPDVMENLHNMAGNRRDKPDVTIEMHGHIVGLSLSPDHKYLYVNCRPWPKNYIISDPQESPPLAQEVEVSTIDLTTFNFVGPVLRSHKAYTHSDECFFLNLDVSDDYVASGAEDRQGYLWDRHYGIPLYRFPHRNVVNCVAINPQDSEILVTVSDDFTFKVWMSRCRASELTGSHVVDKGTSV